VIRGTPHIGLTQPSSTSRPPPHQPTNQAHGPSLTDAIVRSAVAGVRGFSTLDDPSCRSLWCCPSGNPHYCEAPVSVFHESPILDTTRYGYSWHGTGHHWPWVNSAIVIGFSSLLPLSSSAAFRCASNRLFWISLSHSGVMIVTFRLSTFTFTLFPGVLNRVG